MEKQITRDSKFRHVFGKVWKKESAVINLKIKASGAFIKGNAKFSVLPWETVGGALAVIPTGYAGKLPDKCPLIRSHQSNLVDVAFNPFDENLFGIAARESVIKFYRVEDGGITEDITEALFSLEGHKTRIQCLSFHPSAANLLLSVSADKTQKIWDINTQSDLITFPLPNNDVLSVSWFQNGKLFASSSKDKLLRIYDPRSSPSPILEAQAHDGLNGFHVTYMENDRILTSGSTKDSRYQLSLWDLRMPSSPSESSSSPPQLTSVVTNTYTPYPSLYAPYYDPGTGLTYLTSRGDGILVYEVNNIEPYTHQITKIVVPNYSDCFLLPKRIYDVKDSEVARFVLLGKQSVETTSIFVPRKSSSSIFQEDIFPPVPSTRSTNTAEEWFKGVDTEPDHISLCPPGMTSIYQLSESEGGKNAETERIKRLVRTGSSLPSSLSPSGPVILPTPERVNGYVDHHLGGWSAPWAKRYMVIEEEEGVQFFKDDVSMQMIFSISFDDIKSVVVDERLTDQIIVNAKKQYRFKLETPEIATSWASSLSIANDNYHHPSRIEKRSTPPSANNNNNNNNNSSSSSGNNNNNDNGGGGGGGNIIIVENKEGFLETLVTGTVYTGTTSWSRRWYVIDGKMLYSYSSNRKMHQHPLEKISLSKITAVIKSATSSIAEKPYSFKVLTQGQVMYLAAENEEDQDHWIKALLYASPLGKQLAFNEQEDTTSYVLNSATEGYLQRKAPLNPKLPSSPSLSSPSSPSSSSSSSSLSSQQKPPIHGGGGWEKVWVSSAGLYLLYFTSEIATTPLEKYTIKNIKNVHVVEDTSSDFIIHFTDGKSIHHRAMNTSSRNEWVDKLDFLRKQFVDIFDVFRISDREVESQDAINRIEANVIDPVEIKNGNCPLLIQIKGRKRIRVALVECKVTSLSKKSSYVLDAGKALYQWNGAESPRVTRAKAVDLANKIRMKERGGLSQIFVLDEGVNDDNPVFWRLLAGQKSDVPSLNAATDDDHLISIKIYRVYDSTVARARRIQLIHDSSKLPPKEYLDSKSTSVVDSNTEIFVWIGASSKPYQRRLAMLLAKKLTQEANREKFTAITRIVENGETILFKEKFSNYPGMLPINVSRQVSKGKIAQSQEQEPIDVLMMHQLSSTDESTFGHSGEIKQIFRIDNFEKYPLPPSLWGHFYQGDSYIIQYQYYMEGVGKDLFVLFYWQGVDSSRSEKGTSAYITVDLSDELGQADQQRIVQDKEPSYFLKIFSSSQYIVHIGKDPASASASAPSPSPSALQMIQSRLPRMYSIYGENEWSCYPAEVPLTSSSLHSFRCFVVLNDDNDHSSSLWIGRYATPLATTAARRFASTFGNGNKMKEIKEGNEGGEFWQKLGGKHEYYDRTPQNYNAERRHPTRFFSVSNASGIVQVSEVIHFSQEDLNDYHCAILDLFHELYIWFGSNSPDYERQMAMETAIEYVKQSPVGHVPETPLYVCQAYTEPISFTSQFRSWTKKNFPENKKNLPVFVSTVDDVLQRYTTVTYSYEELLSDNLPPGVNHTKLEQYLSNEEFEKVFKMTRSEYMKLPMWQADKLKQQAKLF